MKNTLLFTTLIAGVVLTGCNRSTRTSTADTTPATDTTYGTTSSATTDTTNALERAGDRAGAATRSAADSVGDATRNAADRVGDASRNAADSLGDATRRASDNVRDAASSAAASMREAGRDLSAKMSEWRLSASELQADLQADRPIVRSKSNFTTPTGNIDEGNIESAIKGRLQADSKLANLKFDVNANDKGEVELEGKARTADQVAQAMAIALSNENVAKVTSKIELDEDAGR